MTRLDSARETAGRTRDTLAPYATTAKETAQHYADEAKQRLGPTLEALGPKVGAASAHARTGAAQAAQTARLQYVKHVAPQLEHAFSALPPHTQETTLKAVHRAQEAALAAKHSAAKAAEQARTAADQARSTVVPKVTVAVEGARSTIAPVAQEAQLRGAAALTALHGHVSADEISQLAAKNIKREQRNHWATGLAVAGTIAVGTGVIAWQWWRKQCSPEWLVEPPASQSPSNNDRKPEGEPRPGGSHASSAAGGDTLLNGSVPREQQGDNPGGNPGGNPGSNPGGHASGSTPKPNPAPGKPAPDDRPKPHDPRKPH
ncbi:DUF5324 family protein [Kitasatospora atroaurantiaca]|uniref:DUF5324 family protein n=1 Tax=Kitasatospora atroaurantiaca TaxID=285545 RepID=UPI00119EAC96|nr:DUF5324 family protein [Kitasatospora atroaurantiaca]